MDVSLYEEVEALKGCQMSSRPHSVGNGLTHGVQFNSFRVGHALPTRK
jgi:hypothetical protein